MKNISKLILKNLGELIVGRKLSHSVKKLYYSIKKRTSQEEHILEVFVQLFYRFTRIGITAILLSCIPLFLLYQQNEILKNQNKLVKIQNKSIENQTQLIESQRRSSIMLVYGNILEQIDKDLLRNKLKRDLTPQTIGNIISLSKGLKPYSFLEGSTLYKKQLSPERGQLLNTLLHSGISKNSLDKIFESADFSNSDLRGFILIDVYCKNCNLKGSEMQNCNLSKSNFTNSNLENVNMENVNLIETKLNDSKLSNSNFNETYLSYETEFEGSVINDPTWFDSMKQSGYHRTKIFNRIKNKYYIDIVGLNYTDRTGLVKYGFKIIARKSVIYKKSLYKEISHRSIVKEYKQ